VTVTRTLPRLLEHFFRQHLVVRRNVSDNTLRAYRDAIVLLLRFAATRLRRDVSNVDLVHLDRAMILAFLDDLETGRRNSVRTRNARLATLHSFFRFVTSEEPGAAFLCRSILDIPFKLGERRSVTCLERSEIEQLLAAPDRRTPAGRRDAALLWFLYNTGARASEVVDVRVPAVRLAAPAQVRLFGKGRKERLCPLWPETTGLLRDMLRDRAVSEHADEPLFLNAVGQALSRFGVRHIVRKHVAGAARLHPELAARRISPHTFRHTTALHLLQSGVELNVVRSWLGHVSIETTHQYIEIDMATKRSALAAAAPRLNRRKAARWKEPRVLEWLASL
jgi:site-specific recombinase XerD